MTNLQTIEKEAVVLSTRERISLITTLLATFGKSKYSVSDEEVRRRDAEMDARVNSGISHSDFVKSMGR